MVPMSGERRAQKKKEKAHIVDCKLSGQKFGFRLFFIPKKNQGSPFLRNQVDRAFPTYCPHSGVHRSPHSAPHHPHHLKAPPLIPISGPCRLPLALRNAKRPHHPPKGRVFATNRWPPSSYPPRRRRARAHAALPVSVVASTRSDAVHTAHLGSAVKVRGQKTPPRRRRRGALGWNVRVDSAPIRAHKGRFIGQSAGFPRTSGLCVYIESPYRPAQRQRRRCSARAGVPWGRKKRRRAASEGPRSCARCDRSTLTQDVVLRLGGGMYIEST